MGNYVTAETFEEWLGNARTVRLTNDDRGATTVDVARLNGAIEDAEADMNAALGVKYQLPLSPPYPTVVVALTRRLTRWWLWDRRDQKPPQAQIDQYKADRKVLDQIRKGELDLGLDTVGEVASVARSSRARIHGNGQPRVFGSGGMTGF
jgi:phage gp36-like protein